MCIYNSHRVIFFLLAISYIIIYFDILDQYLIYLISSYSQYRLVVIMPHPISISAIRLCLKETKTRSKTLSTYQWDRPNTQTEKYMQTYLYIGYRRDRNITQIAKIDSDTRIRGLPSHKGRVLNRRIINLRNRRIPSEQVAYNNEHIRRSRFLLGILRLVWHEKLPREGCQTCGVAPL